MLRFIKVVLALALLGLPLTAMAAAPETYSLVRLQFDGADGVAYLRAHPELDVVTVKPGVSADIVTTARTLDVVRASGMRYEVVHEDLAAFYASRITSRDGGNFGLFHTYSENTAVVDSLRMLHPNIVSAKWSLGVTGQGRNIWAFRISDNPDVDEDEPEVLFDGMHHAREIMTSEFLIMFADYLCQHYGSDPVITWLVDNREVYIVPIMNPDGVCYNEQTDPLGGGMWRKNRRVNVGGSYGVDLNRNYPYQWGYDNVGSSPYPDDDTYRGPSAGSEPEVQALMGLINAHHFVTHNSYHSYQGLTLFPWGYTLTPCPDDATFNAMGAIMCSLNGYQYGSAPELLYSTNGSTTDWAYGATTGHPKIYTFSNEIGDSGFWPPESDRGRLFQETLWPSIYLMMAAGPFVEVSNAVATDSFGGPLGPGETGRLNLTVSNRAVDASLTNVTLTFACDDPYVQLTQAARTIASLAAMGSTTLGANPIPFTVSASCPNGHLVSVTVTASWNGGSIAYPVSFMVGSPSQIFFDDFSLGTGNWTFAGGPWGTTTTAHSAPLALTDSPSGNYVDNLFATATLNGSYYASTLTYWQRYVTETGYDYCYVQVSANNGAWNTVATYNGSNTTWHQVTIDLSPYAGQSLRLRFVLSTDVSVQRDGWYIDDVQLLGAGSTNVAPPPPTLVAPDDGAQVGSPTPLVVANSADPDGAGPVTYGFRVYSDALLTQLAATIDGVAEGAGQTSWNTGSLADGVYWWRAYAADPELWGQLGEARTFTVSTSTAVDGPIVLGPRLAVLGGGGGQARLQLTLGQPADAQVRIYNARGMLVRDLFDGRLDAGQRVLVWDGRDGNGRTAASGVYFVRAVTGGQALTGRVTMVR
jgi:carboxypeptidase T